MTADDAFAKTAEEEAVALRHLLEREGRKVMVLVLTSEGHEVAMCRSVSEQTTRNDAYNLMAGLIREHDRIAQLTSRRTD